MTFDARLSVSPQLSLCEEVPLLVSPQTWARGGTCRAEGIGIVQCGEGRLWGGFFVAFEHLKGLQEIWREAVYKGL